MALAGGATGADKSAIPGPPGWPARSGGAARHHDAGRSKEAEDVCLVWQAALEGRSAVRRGLLSPAGVGVAGPGRVPLCPPPVAVLPDAPPAPRVAPRALGPPPPHPAPARPPPPPAAQPR